LHSNFFLLKYIVARCLTSRGVKLRNFIIIFHCFFVFWKKRLCI